MAFGLRTDELQIAIAQLCATLSIAAGIANLQDVAGLLPFFPRTIIWLAGGAIADIVCSLDTLFLSCD